MNETIDRELATRKVQQIAVVLDGALAMFNTKSGNATAEEIIDDLGLTLETLQTLVRAVMADIAGEDE